MIEAIIAIFSLGVGDYADPLDLNSEDKDKKIIMQTACETTTSSDAYGQVSTIKTCRTMKTVETNEEKD
jgi:sorbitol-specific phosphotransferase system component IIBC